MYFKLCCWLQLRALGVSTIICTAVGAAGWLAFQQSGIGIKPVVEVASLHETIALAQHQRVRMSAWISNAKSVMLNPQTETCCCKPIQVGLKSLLLFVCLCTGLGGKRVPEEVVPLRDQPFSIVVNTTCTIAVTVLARVHVVRLHYWF